jgi:hypothetical protein
MQSADGEVTTALDNLRALSGHHAGFYTWAKMRFSERDPYALPEEERTDEMIKDWNAFIHDYKVEWEKNWTEQSGKRAKVVFLSATPFSYIKTVDWAEVISLILHHQNRNLVIILLVDTIQAVRVSDSICLISAIE